MRSILITGCSRGIGLELVKQFLSHQTSKPEILIATVRDARKAKELQELAEQDKSLHILELDVTHFDSFKSFGDKVHAVVGDRGLNVLFHNAGILCDKDGKLEDVTEEKLTSQLLTNAVGPILLTKEMIRYVKMAADDNKSLPLGVNKAAVLFMSSLLGSVTYNKGEFGGGYWGYRESKAALDMAARTITKEVHNLGIGVMVLHPGWVETDMGGPNAPVSVQDSVHGLIEQILTLNESNNGCFIAYDKKELLW